MEFLPALTQAIDEQKPSLFELIASTQLSTLIPPSLRYILAVFTHRHPRYLLRVLNSFDELYALLMLVVERHYLRKYSGSFTENFYGLKRERCLIGGEIPRSSIAAPGLVRETLKLGRKDIWKNLAILVGIPYVKRKLDESYDINAPRALLGGNYTRMPANPTFKQRILHYYRWFLRNIYPSVNAAYYFAILAFNVAYLFDGSRFHDPFLWMVGSRMRRLGRADFEAVAAMEAAESGGLGGDSASGLGTTSILHPRILGPRLLSSLKILLPTSIFALKFLEWWHASDFARQLSRKASEGLELPPPVIAGLRTSLSDPTTSKSNSNKPPTTSNPSEQEKEPESPEEEKEPPNPPISASSLLPIFTIPTPKDSSLCPICEKDITTATVCQTGYVFCYTCIHRWIEGGHDRQESFIREGGRDGKWESGKGRCAVSGRKVLGGTEGLRRVMV